jgi:hypothetical protein
MGRCLSGHGCALWPAAIALFLFLLFDPARASAGPRHPRPGRRARLRPATIEVLPIRHRGSRAIRLPVVSAQLCSDGPRVRLRPWLLLWRDTRGRVVGANGWLGTDRFHWTTYQWRQHVPANAFIVGAHGVPGDFEQLPTARAIAAFSPAARRLGHVFLQVCSGAVDGPNGVSLALLIARATGRPVVAANGPIMGNTVPGEEGGSRLAFTVLSPEPPDAPDVLAANESWSVVYPDGRKRPLIMARYFSRVQPSGDSLADHVDPRAAAGMIP